MSETIYNQLHALKSRISFQPLMKLWKEVSETNDKAAALICKSLYERFCQIPGLLEPIEDYDKLKPYKDLINEAMTTIFPASFSKRKELYAVAMPFSSKPIYASSFYKFTYLDEFGNFLLPLDPQVAKNIAAAKVELAYKLILQKWYDIELIGGNAFICSYPEREQNIHNYFELEWDPQFIDITTLLELPTLPEDFKLKCHHVKDLILFPELSTLLPLDQFIFEGLVITRIREVSERETVNIIRGILQRDDCFENSQWIRELKQQILYLLRMDDAEIGITTFYDAGNEAEIPSINYASIILQHIRKTDKIIDFCNQLANQLKNRPEYFWWLDPAADQINPVDRQLKKDGWQSALISALYHNEKIIGCLEIVTKNGEPVKRDVLIRVGHVREILELAVKQNQQQVFNKISYLVKEHFTAVQPSVEWKFNNAAVRYLLKQHEDQLAEMESVIFEKVYPLYGFIDIRNSSTERNLAIQQDLIYQLQWVKKIVEHVKEHITFPLFDELYLSAEKHIASVSGFLFAGNEQAVQHFFQKEVPYLFQYAAKTVPACRSEIEAYFHETSSNSDLLSIHREKFEESVTKINSSIVQHLEIEQRLIQEKYPHYFERFVTDGLEFNMYIGQTITPGTRFRAAHLRDARLWQFSFLATAARRIHHLQDSLPVPLQTAQLILVHGETICIRFRNAERKFDLDGVHHARYEILKKRIDKALIKGTNQRLTQPGTIAIVYSNDDEIKEYYQYVEILKKQGLLIGSVEHYELDDLQGVSGLKALRVAIDFEETVPIEVYKEKKVEVNS